MTTVTGEWLRAEREALGLSQTELAKILGVHSNTLAKVERGEQGCSWPGALLLAIMRLRENDRRPTRA